VLTRLLEGQLYDVRAHDPITYVILSAALALLAAAASALPARRAARTDPARALSLE
jgi:putative ABC transport system permease protein